MKSKQNREREHYNWLRRHNAPRQAGKHCRWCENNHNGECDMPDFLNDVWPEDAAEPKCLEFNLVRSNVPFYLFSFLAGICFVGILTVCSESFWLAAVLLIPFLFFAALARKTEK